MREIKFRAKRNYNNKWVYGFFAGIYSTEDGEVVCIKDLYGKDNLCVKETLGQFTGLKDSNGKEIYEGDIVKLYEPQLKTEWTAIVEFGNPNGVYDWGYQLKPITNNAIKYHYNLDILCWVGMEDVNVYCEIISNIYENKELIG